MLAGKPCRALVDGAEVKSYKLAAIPDVLVACGELDQRTPTIAEPVVMVEVIRRRASATTPCASGRATA